MVLCCGAVACLWPCPSALLMPWTTDLLALQLLSTRSQSHGIDLVPAMLKPAPSLSQPVL